MYHLTYAKAIIDGLQEAAVQISKEQILLLLMTSEFSHQLQDLDVEEIAYLLGTGKKEVTKILRNLLGRKPAQYTNSEGVKIVTAKERSWLLNNHKDKCLAILASYKIYSHSLEEEN